MVSFHYRSDSKHSDKLLEWRALQAPLRWHSSSRFETHAPHWTNSQLAGLQNTLQIYSYK